MIISSILKEKAKSSSWQLAGDERDSLAIMGIVAINIHSALSNEVMFFHALNYFIYCESSPIILLLRWENIFS